MMIVEVLESKREVEALWKIRERFRQAMLQPTYEDLCPPKDGLPETVVRQYIK